MFLLPHQMPRFINHSTNQPCHQPNNQPQSITHRSQRALAPSSWPWASSSTMRSACRADCGFRPARPDWLFDKQGRSQPKHYNIPWWVAPPLGRKAGGAVLKLV